MFLIDIRCTSNDLHNYLDRDRKIFFLLTQKEYLKLKSENLLIFDKNTWGMAIKCTFGHVFDSLRITRHVGVLYAGCCRYAAMTPMKKIKKVSIACIIAFAHLPAIAISQSHNPEMPEPNRPKIGRHTLRSIVTLAQTLFHKVSPFL